MKFIKTEHPDIFIIEPTVYKDSRGWFMETWLENEPFLKDRSIHFVQDNHSFTKKKGTIRGIHFQNYPMSQTKLVRCVSGAVLDVAIDLRRGSPFYLKWVAVELSAKNKKQLFIPQGFGHGFLTLTKNVEFVYKVDAFYSKELDRSVKYNDLEMNINWNIKKPFVSKKDSLAPNLSDSDLNFTYVEQKQQN